MQTRTLAISLVLLAALSGPGFAHAHLQSAKPPIDGTVSAPSELDLTFSESLNLAFTGATLSGPDKAIVPAGKAALGGGGMTLVVPLAAKPAPGQYAVEWHALSADGHKTNGRYTFTVIP